MFRNRIEDTADETFDRRGLRQILVWSILPGITSLDSYDTQTIDLTLDLLDALTVLYPTERCVI